MTSNHVLQCEAAVIKFLAGTEAQRLEPLADQKRQLALHESGHCVLGAFFGSPATRVIITPPRGAAPGVAGATTHSESGTFDRMVFVPWRGRLSSDQRSALLFIRLGDLHAGWRLVLGRYRVLRQRTRDAVQQHRGVIVALADRLLELGEMDAEQIRSTIEDATRAAGAARLKYLLGATDSGPIPQEEVQNASSN